MLTVDPPWPAAPSHPCAGDSLGPVTTLRPESRHVPRPCVPPLAAFPGAASAPLSTPPQAQAICVSPGDRAPPSLPTRPLSPPWGKSRLRSQRGHSLDFIVPITAHAVTWPPALLAFPPTPEPVLHPASRVPLQLCTRPASHTPSRPLLPGGAAPPQGAFCPEAGMAPLGDRIAGGSQ